MALIKWCGFAEIIWEPVAELQEIAALDTYKEKYGPIEENNGPPEVVDGHRRGRR